MSTFLTDRRGRQLGTILAVGGQAIWALSQAVIVAVLSRQSELNLIGLFTVGLATFAPLCLLGGLNLRVAVSMDHKKVISPRLALGLRAAVAVTNVVITAALLWPAATTLTLWSTAVVLVATRAADQISDVAVGFFQREGRQSAIARSFAVRGIANLLPFSGMILAGTGVNIAALSSLFTSITAVMIFDVQPLLRQERSPASVTFIDVRHIISQNFWLSPYPLLDSLHLNSFRFAMFLSQSGEYVGLIGVAQAMFAPFQLIATALGFEYLPEAREIANRRDRLAMRLHLLRGLVYGFLLTAGYIACAQMTPIWAWGQIYGDRAAEAQSAAILVGFAMLPVTATGFAAWCLVARHLLRPYAISPLLGLVPFGAFIAAIEILQAVFSPSAVAYAFLISAGLRLVFVVASTVWLSDPADHFSSATTATTRGDESGTR